MLMEKGGDVNVLDGEHHTPVHVAAHMGLTAIVTFLTQTRWVQQHLIPSHLPKE